MTCSDFTELFELYVLGVLEPGEADALRDHLDTGCQTCAENLRVALQQTAALSAAVPLVEPPARLRRRIQATFVPDAKPKRGWALFPWALAAAATVALVVGGGLELRNRNAESARLAQSSDEARRMAQMLKIVQAPGTKQVSFGVPADGLPVKNVPQGSLFIHAKLGVAVTVANLPAAPDGWKYESWVLPKQGAPQPVEFFPALSGNRAVTVVPGPVNVEDWSAVAVSMEPADSRPSKPTKLVFSAPV